MTTKLTLSVDRHVVQKAKRYAQKHNKSLSQMVTNYLNYLTNENENLSEIDPDVLDVADEIPIHQLPKLTDAKYRYLKDKYLHA